MTRRPMLLNWSGGKDSALALQRLRLEDPFHIHALLTTVNDERDRISMHGVRSRRLLENPCSVSADAFVPSARRKAQAMQRDHRRAFSTPRMRQMHRIRTNGNANTITETLCFNAIYEFLNGPISRRSSASLGVDDALTASPPSRSLICLEIEPLTIQGFSSSLLACWSARRTRWISP